MAIEPGQGQVGMSVSLAASLTTTPQVLELALAAGDSRSSAEPARFRSLGLVVITLDTIVTAVQVTLQLCADALGDHPISSPVNATATIANGETAATGSATWDFSQIPYLLGEGGIFAVVSLDAGTATADIEHHWVAG